VPMVAHAILLACQFSNKLKVHRLETVTAKEDWTPQDYAQHVRNVISQKLSIPQSPLKLEDKVERLQQIYNSKQKLT